MTLYLSSDALDTLMPMHLIVNRTGHITHAAPTLERLQNEATLTGRRLLEVFEVRRPGGITALNQLSTHHGRKLHLRLRSDKGTSFKGQIVPTGADEGLLLNLSFGIGVIEAVRDHALTSGDFAPTDLTVEMLYLVEAKSAVMEELKKLNARLESARVSAQEQAFTDMLTGLFNRRAMDHALGSFIEQGRLFGLMHLDLDYFKDVNDTMGHVAGDHVLQHVADVLVAETRSDDIVVRAGGDEFVILFPDITCPRKLNDIALRIIAQLEKPILFNDVPCRISASVGTTISDFYRPADADRMLADADAALYASKHDGRARATLFSETLRTEASAAAGAPVSPRHDRDPKRKP